MRLDLTKLDTLKKLLSKHNLTPKHTAGQNFLICEEVVESTLLAMDKRIENVTELGSGLGSLTQGLVANGYNVHAIERDESLMAVAQKVIGKDAAQWDRADLKQVNWEQDEPYYLVGNIPYNLSGLIIRKVTQLEKTPVAVILLVQKEVGERMTESEPNLSILGLSVQLWGKAEKLMNVPASCFWPAPKVSSALIMMIPEENMQLSLAEREEVLKTAKIFFQTKRKQIGGSLKRNFKLTDEETSDILETADIDPAFRPQQVSAQKWIRLNKVLKN